MKRVLGLFAAIAVVSSLGCGEDAAAPPPAAPAPPPAAAPAPPPAAVDTSAATPPVPQKQVLSITTKSPDAKVAFLKSWDLVNNGHTEEALDQCKQAVTLDPDFALAHACIGSLTPGAAGQAENDKAQDLAAKLPDAERLQIEAWWAYRHNDRTKGDADLKKVAALAPDDYLVQEQVAGMLIGSRDFDGATAALHKALDTNPAAYDVYGSLSWVLSQQGKYEDALAAAQKYAAGAPSEGGAHQALAGALLNASKPKDAEAELTKALDLASKSRQVYYDLATVKAINGDYAGALDVLERSKTTETLPAHGLDRVNLAAWTLAAQGKSADAAKLLDATEKDIDARKLVWPAHVAMIRGWLAVVQGRPADALKAVTGASGRCDRPESSEGYKAECRRDMLSIQALAQLDGKKGADAQKTVAKLRDETGAAHADEWQRVRAGILSDEADALAKKDGKAPAAILAKCPPDALVLKLSVMRLALALGDKATAAQIKTDLLGRPRNEDKYALVAQVLAKK